jgi:hypothetical protein
MNHEQLISFRVRNFVLNLNKKAKKLMIEESLSIYTEEELIKETYNIYRDFFDGIGRYFFIAMSRLTEDSSFPESIKNSLLESNPHFQDIFLQLFALQSEIESLAIKKANKIGVVVFEYPSELQRIKSEYVEIALESF